MAERMRTGNTEIKDSKCAFCGDTIVHDSDLPRFYYIGEGVEVCRGCYYRHTLQRDVDEAIDRILALGIEHSSGRMKGLNSALFPSDYRELPADTLRRALMFLRSYAELVVAHNTKKDPLLDVIAEIQAVLLER